MFSVSSSMLQLSIQLFIPQCFKCVAAEMQILIVEYVIAAHF